MPKKKDPTEQTEVPGTEQVPIAELTKIGRKLQEADDERLEWKNEADKLRGAMALAMEKHETSVYTVANKRFSYEPGAPKLKIKTLKDDGEE